MTPPDLPPADLPVHDAAARGATRADARDRRSLSRRALLAAAAVVPVAFAGGAAARGGDPPPPAGPAPAGPDAAPHGTPAPAAPGIVPEVVRPSDLVWALRGTLPLVIVAAHGGTARIPGAVERTAGVRKRDVATLEIAVLVATRVAQATGRKPYLVGALFHRKDADANRPVEEGTASPAAAAEHAAHHGAIRAYVDEVRRVHGAGLLVDVHGQARLPDAVVRGTRNGKTVTRLLAARGAAALTGPDGIFGRLAAGGFVVVPPNEGGDEPGSGDDDDGLAPERILAGGYTVDRYGSHREDGIDAVQIELGSRLRERVEDTAKALAEALVAFLAAHGPGAPSKR